MARYLVAMSGGVDSSVAAALLRRQGHEVVGITMNVWDGHTRPPQEALPSTATKTATNRDDRCEIPSGSKEASAPTPQLPDVPDVTPTRTCCAPWDIQDARRVAEKLGIPHYTLNLRDAFRETVIRPFVEGRLKGYSPIPCVACNDVLKFGALVDKARALGLDGVATGHYARLAKGPDGRPRLLRGADLNKDQSYFLCHVPPSGFDDFHFPLGELTKPQVREMAREWGLRTADKPDSQEICFVRDHHAATVAEFSPHATPGEGDIVCADTGRVLGRHPGHIHFTVGQRRGLRLPTDTPDTAPRFVVAIDAERNRVFVGPEARLGMWGLLADGLNLIHQPILSSGTRVLFKIRHSTQLYAGEIAGDTSHGGALALRFDHALPRVTPGHVLALHQADDPDVVLGGAIIRQGVEAL